MVPAVDLTALSDETLNQHFMPRIAVPDHESWLHDDLAASAEIRRKLAAEGGWQLDRRYGPAPRHVVDFFPSRQPNAPILVWMHGGYWRALSKEHYTNIAPPLLEAGAAVVLVGYDLCPSVTLAEQLTETRAALRWVRENVAAAFRPGSWFPKRPTRAKWRPCGRMGAEVIFHGAVFDEARLHCQALAQERGYRYIHPRDEPLLIAGVATQVLEMLEDQPDLQAIFVPVVEEAAERPEPV